MPISESPAHRVEDFHFGAAVYSSDGENIGELRRLIVDQDTMELHAIVAQETRRFSGHHLAAEALVEDDLAIPTTTLRSVTRERIDVVLSTSELRHLHPYLSYRTAPLTGGDVGKEALVLLGASVGYIPRLIERHARHPGELEVRPGENVMLGRTGRRLGTVRDVLVDAGELIGIVMHPDGFFKEDVVLQVRFLDRSDDLALFAHLTEEDLKHLEPFHP
ncbi:MAG: hypothetical protein E6J14_02955 [Chloroflexi bacterium]|nr:MAG: hypothetical protein E6J14_02955 [Chloroflexota bacterium]